VLFGVVDGQPSTTPIGFVLAKDRLVTIRYATPKPVLSFSDHVRREPDLARDATTVLIRLLDAIIDRLADELENVGSEMEQISAHIFARDIEARRIPAARLTALLVSALAAAAFLAAWVSARVAVALALRWVVARAAAPWLAARVAAAFLAVVERLVAFVLRVVAAFWAGVAVVGLVVVSAMIWGLLVWTKDISSKSVLRTVVPERVFVNPGHRMVTGRERSFRCTPPRGRRPHAGGSCGRYA
jgi:hypothetical protein